MPIYFFHASFGDRVYHDEEGLEFPSRSAAQAEAFAVTRELSRGSDSEAPHQRRGWLLRVADEEGEFLCLPIGYPALAVVSRSASHDDKLRTEESDLEPLNMQEPRASGFETPALLKRLAEADAKFAVEVSQAKELALQARELVWRSQFLRQQPAYAVESQVSFCHRNAPHRQGKE